MSLAGVFEHPALAGRLRRLFWAAVAVGTLIRLYVAFSTRGQVFDITSFELVRDALRDGPFDLYGTVNAPDAPHWPYPPGLLPWIEISHWASEATGLRFDGFVQTAAIAADAAIAWIVQAFLGQRGVSDRLRVAAAALVVLGPSFAVVSGYHGQIDSVCILPAIIGFWVWVRSDSPNRAVIAGLLIGLGIAVKAPAGLILLALLPSVRSFRELAALCVTAAAVPITMLAPFLITDFSATVDGLTANKGLPGFGGISLLAQPDLSALWLRTKEVSLSPLSQTLFDHGAIFALATLLLTTAYLFKRRAAASAAVVIVLLTYYAFSINFGLSYLVLGMPFFLMMGRIREVFALQLAVLVPTMLLYINKARDLPLEIVYTPIMLVVWVALVWWWFVELRAVPPRAAGAGETVSA